MGRYRVQNPFPAVNYMKCHQITYYVNLVALFPLFKPKINHKLCQPTLSNVAGVHR